MPLFRRKPAELVADPPATTDDATTAADEVGADRNGRAYTPPKGRETPKRASVQRRRVAEPVPRSREERRELRRREQMERAEGMRRGDERYLLHRDRGPERRLVRDIVDSRRTAGTWFFGGALVVIVGSSAAMPPVVKLASNLVWVALALAVVIDSVLIARRIKRLVRERFPRTQQRMGSLYYYGIMRGLTFRRMRVPKPQVDIGQNV